MDVFTIVLFGDVSPQVEKKSYKNALNYVGKGFAGIYGSVTELELSCLKVRTLNKANT